MADSMQGFLNKHVEKIVLAAAIVVFAASLIVFVVMRDSVFGNQDQVRSRVETLVGTLGDSRKAPDIVKVLTTDERIALGIEQAPPTGEQFIKERDGLSAVWDPSIDKWAEPKAKDTTIVVVPEAPAIVPVADLQVFQGRGTTAETVQTAVFRLEKPTPLADIVWAGVVGHMNLTEQLAAYNKANVHPLDPNGIIISKVELQRREQKPDGTWSEWKPVMPALATASAAKWPKTPVNPRDKAAVGAWYVALRTLQADIRRMPLYTLLAKDKQGQTADAVAGAIVGVEQPEMKKPSLEPVAAAPAAAGAAAPAAEAPAPAAPEAPAPGTLPPWLQAVTPAKTEPAPGAVPPAPAGPKHVIATLWAYDTSVEPGKTYQYQMRASVFNPIYSNSEVKDDKARWAIEFAGAWSAASREVSVPNLAEFFFVGTAGADKVNLELHRWILGQWVMQPSVQCNLGGPIVYTKRQKLSLPGAKGAGKDAMTPEAINVDMSPQVLLVDVLRRFPYVPEGNTKPTLTNILIYATARGQLERRTEWDEKNALRAAKTERVDGGVTPLPPPTPKPTPPTPPTPRPKPEPRPPRTKG
jgi:hypothetical protein